MSLIRRLAESGEHRWLALPVIDRCRVAAVVVCVPLATVFAAGAHVPSDYGGGSMLSYPVMDMRVQESWSRDLQGTSRVALGRQAEAVPAHRGTEMTFESIPPISGGVLFEEGTGVSDGDVHGAVQGPLSWTAEASDLSVAREEL